MTAPRGHVASSTVAPSVHQLLDQASAALDTLMSDVSLGIRDQRHFDALEERGQAIAAEIRAAFRGTR